jgi:proteasome lid subunit RPN8/RPN11
MTEQCWVLLGVYDEREACWRLRIRGHVSGRPADVEADWRWAMDREEACGDVAGFAHTHPVGSGTKPSDRDMRTMEAWCSAFGKPLICLIAEGETLNDPAAYLFTDDEAEPRPVTEFEVLEEGSVAHD